MLRRTRVFLAVVMITLVTLLFLDVSGTMAKWLAWTAKIQFFPALLALNAGVVVALLLLTLLLGRVYCSVICPLGVLQDVVAHVHTAIKPERYRHSRGVPVVRLVFFVVFAVLVCLGLMAAASLIEPYSAYGRIVSSMLRPVWVWFNNQVADYQAAHDMYDVYSVETCATALPVFIVASVTLAVVVVCAWVGGRSYCNSVCPVGTLLGYLSRFSMFRVTIDRSKCVSCGLCVGSCKARCIDASNHCVDSTRCVDCFDCLKHCHTGALKYRYTWRRQPEQAAVEKKKANKEPDRDRRAFMATAVAMAGGAVAAKAEIKFDGGLAPIEDKKVPRRATKIVPPGALSHNNVARRCVGCQLCITKCPQNVLRTSTDVTSLLQPEASYELGYCRPECTACGDVCPAGAITPVTREEKTAIHIGHAVWVEKNCIVTTDEVECGNCARHCPAQAIVMVESPRHDGRKIPAVKEEACIGCGACEYLCPSRPYSAIYVEGHEVHRKS